MDKERLNLDGWAKILFTEGIHKHTLSQPNDTSAPRYVCPEP